MLCLLVFAFLTRSGHAQFGSLDSSFTPPQFQGGQGVLNTAALQPNGQLLVAGPFLTVNGLSKPGIVRLSADGSVDGNFQLAASIVQAAKGYPNITALLVQADGGILIVGNFPSSNPAVGSTTPLVRLLSNGALDPTFSCAAQFRLSSSVAIQPDGRILILAGPGANEPGLVRLNVDGSVDQTFHSALPGGDIKRIALDPNGRIIAGKDYQLVRLNSDGSIDPSFNTGPAQYIPASFMTVDSAGRVLVGGFQSPLVRFNADGSRDTTFVSADVHFSITGAVLQTDGRVIVSGTNCSQQYGLALALLNSDGTVASTAGNISAPIGDVNGVCLQPDGGIIAIGRGTVCRLRNGTGFSELFVSESGGGGVEWYRQGAVPEVNQATFEESFDKGVTWTPLGQGTPDSNGWSLSGLHLPYGSEVRARGYVQTGSGDHSTTVVQDIITYPAPGSFDPTFDSRSNPAVTTGAIGVQPDGQLVLGGTLGGPSATGIARLHPDATADTGFPAGKGPNGPVNAIVIEMSGKMLIGGAFSTVDGFSCPGVARLNFDGSLDEDFFAEVGPYAKVRCLVLQADGKVLLAGTALTGTDPKGGNYLLRLNPDGSLDSSFAGPQPDGAVNCIAIDPAAKIMIGGAFNSIGGVSICHLARLSGNGTLDTSFTSAITEPTPAAPSSRVETVAVRSDGKIYVGGANISGIFLKSLYPAALLRFNSNGTVDNSFTPLLGKPEIQSIALQADGNAVIGGNAEFSIFAGAGTNGLARVLENGQLDRAFNPGTGIFGTIVGLMLESDGKVIATGNFGQGERRFNNSAAIASLVASSSSVRWMTSGAFPDAAQVVFEISTDSGVTWGKLGLGAHVAGGWLLSEVRVPADSLIRASARTAGGIGNGSMGLAEQIVFHGAPTLVSASITSSNANPRLARPGDVVTLTFTSNYPIFVPFVTILGSAAATVPMADNTWVATQRVDTSSAEGVVDFSISASDAGGGGQSVLGATTDSSSVTVMTRTPVIDTAYVPLAGYIAGAQLPDLRVYVSGSEGAALVQSPAAKTVLSAGLQIVTFVATDVAGNRGQANVYLSVAPVSAEANVQFKTGNLVTGTLAPLTYSNLGVPEAGVFVGSYRIGHVTNQAIFAEDGRLLLHVGQNPLGSPGVSISSFERISGDAALARLKHGSGGINRGNDTVLIVGLKQGRPHVIAQTGAVPIGMSPNAVIRSLVGIDGNGLTLFFLANMSDPANGPGSRVALCAALAVGGCRELMHVGDVVDGRQIAIIGTLVSNDMGDHRWRVNDGTIGVRLTFTDGSEAIYSVPANSAGPADWTLLIQSGLTEISSLSGRFITGFGLPCFSEAGVAVTASLASPLVGSSRPNDVLIAVTTSGARVAATQGIPITSSRAGIPDGTIVQALGDPLMQSNGALVCPVTLGIPGDGNKPRAGIVYAPADGEATLLACAGALAPGGGHWSSFSSLRMPRSAFGAPVFIAHLVRVPADHISASNDAGLWGVGVNGQLQLLLRSGQTVGDSAPAKKIQSLLAIGDADAPLSPAGGYDPAYARIEAAFTDGSKAFLQVVLP